MENLLTPDEAAALLANRLDLLERSALPEAVLLERGKFPGARKLPGPGRGLWLIPRGDVDAYVATHAPQ